MKEAYEVSTPLGALTINVHGIDTVFVAFTDFTVNRVSYRGHLHFKVVNGAMCPDGGLYGFRNAGFLNDNITSSARDKMVDCMRDAVRVFHMSRPVIFRNAHKQNAEEHVAGLREKLREAKAEVVKAESDLKSGLAALKALG
jgi:hypothetical protein